MATSVGFRAATQLPQAVRQTTSLPTALPSLPDAAVMGDKAARRVVITKFNEDMRAWWRSTRASIQSDYEGISTGTNTAINAAKSVNDALSREVVSRADGYENLVRQVETLALQTGASHVFVQTEPPEKPVRGDLWFDSDDNFRPWWYSGSGWTDTRDRNSATVTALSTEQTTRINADTALGQRIDSAVAQIADAKQGITGLSTALDAVTVTVTNQDGAITSLATRTTALESTVNTAGTGLTARISTIESTYATKTGAQGYATAAKSEAITAAGTYTDTKVSAAITTESAARASADGYLSGKYTLAVTAGNVVTGMQITSSTGNGTSISEIAFQADRFKIYNGNASETPFEVYNGAVYIKEASIRSLSANKIGAGTISAVTITASTISGATINGGNIYGAGISVDGGFMCRIADSTWQNDASNCGYELGYYKTVNATTWIDFHAQPDVDYSTRIIREAGANGGFMVQHHGTGGMTFWCIEGSDYRFIANSSYLRFGNYGSGGGNVIGYVTIKTDDGVLRKLAVIA